MSHIARVLGGGACQLKSLVLFGNKPPKQDKVVTKFFCFFFPTAGECPHGMETALSQKASLNSMLSLTMQWLYSFCVQKTFGPPRAYAMAGQAIADALMVLASVHPQLPSHTPTKLRLPLFPSL